MNPGRPVARTRLTGTAWRMGWIGLGLLAAAVNTGNNVIYLLFGLLLATLPISLIAARINLAPLRVDLSLPPEPRAGAPFTIGVRLVHRRRALASRGLELQLLTESGTYGPAWVERLDAGSTRMLPLTARRRDRGLLRIVGVRIRSIFPLGFLRREITWPVPAEILILPAGAPDGTRKGRSDLRPGQGELAPAVMGIEFEGLRHGSEQDDVRRVDWKSTARRGVLILRETAGEAQRRLELDLVTRRGDDPRVARARFEEEVSRLATRARRALEAGGNVRLTLDGRQAESYAGRAGTRPLLRRLARVVAKDENGRPLPPIERSEPAGEAAPESAAVGPPRRTPPGRAHDRSALAALAVGVMALGAYEGISPVVFGALAASILAAATLRERIVARAGGWARRIWRAAALVALLVFLADLALRRDPLGASIHLVAFITLYQLFNAATVRDDRATLLVSLLQMVLAAALTTEVSFVVPLAVWLGVAVHGQLAWSSLPASGGGRPILFDPRSRSVRYASAAATLTFALAAAGGILYFIVPHVGTGTYTPGTAARRSTSGFSEQSTLGDIGRIKLDGSLVLEARVSGQLPATADIRWRGLALERFDGRTWSRHDGDEERLVADAEGRFDTGGFDGRADARDPDLLVQEIRLEPSRTQILFAVERPLRISSDDFNLLVLDPAGAMQARTRPGRRVSYRVASKPVTRDAQALRDSSGADPPWVRARALGLPELDPRVAETARRLTEAAATRYDAARAIESWLSRQHVYSLDVQDRGRADPLAAFLFEGMAGHCEYFATGMVMLARSAGIPARLVTGYLRGETNRFSRRYAVRQSDAHAWVEVFFPGVGWVAFDPTPPAGRDVRDSRGIVDLVSDLHATLKRWWDDYLIGVDLEDQFRALLALRYSVADGVERLSPASGAAAGVVALGLVILLIRWPLPGRTRRRHRGRESDRPLPRFYARLLEHLAARGLGRRPGETARELADRARSSLTPLAADRVRQLTDLYYRVRFDPATGRREADRLARALLNDVTSL